MQIDGYTRLAAVVAHPIKHSISPFIHNQAFDKTGVNGVYVAWDIPEEDLAATIENIRRYDMWGINLSMPYKQAVIPYMDELTPSAHLIGAVNTVINQSGKLIGHNTDGRGFFRSLGVLAEFSIQAKEMVILGGGGAATALIAQAALDGAKKITIFNFEKYLARTVQKANDIANMTGTIIEVADIANTALLSKCLARADLFVNGTSVGMDGKSMPIPSDLQLPSHLLVADVIYQPFETPFLCMARQQGLEAINGLGMLLFQAAEAFESWTGQVMPTDDIWRDLVDKYK